MLCSLCHTEKLRREFQSVDICKGQHVERFCLRCITDYIDKHRCCPVCEEDISSTSKEYKTCQKKLKWLFPKFEDDKDEIHPIGDASAVSKIRVVMLGGESALLPFYSGMKVKEFKTYVKKKFNVECEMQKLLYKDQVLESYQSYTFKSMSDYKVQAEGTIQLVKILKTLSPSVEHVIFDFSWGFPNSFCRDYLDASALLYSGSSFIEYVDFRHSSSRQAYGAVTHSGYATTEGDRARHRMNVRLTSLPLHINKVFFTLSSWNSPTIASYKTPRLQFYDTNYPDKQLCSEEFGRAIHHEAVIMCSVCRGADGKWTVYSLGEPSSGNCKWERYCFLEETIEDIIRRGIC